MKTLREQLENLDRATNDKYRELVDEIKGATFYEEETEEFDEDLTDCPVVTIISRSGENVDVKVLEISKNSGIYVAEDDNDFNKFWIGLNDLSSLYDKITIVELLENIE